MKPAKKNTAFNLAFNLAFSVCPAIDGVIVYNDGESPYPFKCEGELFNLLKSCRLYWLIIDNA